VSATLVLAFGVGVMGAIYLGIALAKYQLF